MIAGKTQSDVVPIRGNPEQLNKVQTGLLMKYTRKN